MASLVADYESSSSDTNSDNSVKDTEKTAKRHLTTEEKQPNSYYDIDCVHSSSSDDEYIEGSLGHPTFNTRTSPDIKLPPPEFGGNRSTLVQDTSSSGTLDNTASVFVNPFLAAEEAKTSALEKHVRMSPNVNEQSRMINGQQVCWNYRKGRCRFGHNCKFAHDSDLSTPGRNKEHNRTRVMDRTPVTCNSTVNNLVFTDHPDENASDGDVMKRKRKPGLSNTLVPPKKAMKAYQKQMQEEKPWLTGN